eukprot:g4841.t1
MSTTSSALSSAALLLLAAIASPTCEAFFLPPPCLSAARSSPTAAATTSRDPLPAAGRPLQQLQEQMPQRQRGGGGDVRRSTATLAVSHAAAEEISNMEDVPKLKEPVAISDFEALDIRVGRIVLAEMVPDPDHDNKPSRKYLSLVVDLGNEKRRVVSAVRSIVDVEDAIGKAVLMAANVEEETILGLPSRGKLLSASNFSKEPMPRTLRTVLLGGGGVPPGSAVSGL